jgi:hypothetical protein
MIVRRQYTLPNCTLILEGLSNEIPPAGTGNSQAVLSTLTNAECSFAGLPQKLHGGRVFLENLAISVHNYAQECLSSIRHPQEQQEGEQVHLERLEGAARHRLTWKPANDSSEEPIALELTAVQLFDLVEAVDQFVADSRTLPDFSLKLQPLSRRFRQPDEPLAQRAFPALLGVVSLAVAALAFYFVPVPEVRKPEPKPQASPTQTLPSPSK